MTITLPAFEYRAVLVILLSIFIALVYDFFDYRLVKRENPDVIWQWEVALKKVCVSLMGGTALMDVTGMDGYSVYIHPALMVIVDFCSFITDYRIDSGVKFSWERAVQRLLIGFASGAGVFAVRG